MVLASFLRAELSAMFGACRSHGVNVSKASVGQGGMSGFDQVGASDRFAETQTKRPDVELPPPNRRRFGPGPVDSACHVFALEPYESEYFAFQSKNPFVLLTASDDIGIVGSKGWGRPCISSRRGTIDRFSPRLACNVVAGSCRRRLLCTGTFKILYPKSL